jgi:hypothetical protein
VLFQVELEALFVVPTGAKRGLYFNRRDVPIWYLKQREHGLLICAPCSVANIQDALHNGEGEMNYQAGILVLSHH